MGKSTYSVGIWGGGLEFRLRVWGLGLRGLGFRVEGFEVDGDALLGEPREMLFLTKSVCNYRILRTSTLR